MPVVPVLQFDPHSISLPVPANYTPGQVVGYQSQMVMQAKNIAQVWTADLSRSQIDGLLNLIQATDAALQTLTNRVTALEQKVAALPHP